MLGHRVWEIWLQIQNDQIEVLHKIIVDVTLVTRMSITTVVPTTLHVLILISTVFQRVPLATLTILLLTKKFGVQLSML